MNIHDPNIATPKVTTGPIFGSRKVYVQPETAPDLRVPVREIALDASSGEAPVPVYDTTGPTDPDTAIDVEQGLPRRRTAWVKERGGVEAYEGRPIKPVDNGNGQRQAPGAFLQVHALRASTGTGDAIRVRARASSPRMITSPSARSGRKVARAAEAARADGESFGASVPLFVTPGIVRSGLRVAAPSFLQHQPRRTRADDHRPQLPHQDQRQYRQLADRRSRKVEKMVWAIRGRDTVMDLHRRNIHNTRECIIRNPGSAPADLPGAGEGRRRSRDWVLQGHPHRAMRAGRRLFHHPCGVRLAYVPLTANRVTGIVSRGGSS
jgi:phosphomethylpyrimidine synthase